MKTLARKYEIACAVGIAAAFFATNEPAIGAGVGSVFLFSALRTPGDPLRAKDVASICLVAIAVFAPVFLFNECIYNWADFKEGFMQGWNS